MLKNLLLTKPPTEMLGKSKSKCWVVAIFIHLIFILFLFIIFNDFTIFIILNNFSINNNVKNIVWINMYTLNCFIWNTSTECSSKYIHQWLTVFDLQNDLELSPRWPCLAVLEWGHHQDVSVPLSRPPAQQSQADSPVSFLFCVRMLSIRKFIHQ